ALVGVQRDSLMSMTFKSLTPATSYVFRVVAHRQGEDSPSSDTLTATTSLPVLPAAAATFYDESPSVRLVWYSSDYWHYSVLQNFNIGQDRIVVQIFIDNAWQTIAANINPSH